VSGLVFWMYGLVFWCLDLYLDVWTCILGVCMLVGCDYGVSARRPGTRARGPGPADPGPARARWWTWAWRWTRALRWTRARQWTRAQLWSQARQRPQPGCTNNKKTRVPLANTGGFLVSTPTVPRWDLLIAYPASRQPSIREAASTSTKGSGIRPPPHGGNPHVVIESATVEI